MTTLTGDGVFVSKAEPQIIGALSALTTYVILWALNASQVACLDEARLSREQSDFAFNFMRESCLAIGHFPLPVILGVASRLTRKL